MSACLVAMMAPCIPGYAMRLSSFCCYYFALFFFYFPSPQNLARYVRNKQFIKHTAFKDVDYSPDCTQIVVAGGGVW
jgi:hypothetical protein